VVDVPLPLDPDPTFPRDDIWTDPMTDMDGVSHPNPLAAFATLIGLCGCGRTDALAADAAAVLRWRATWADGAEVDPCDLDTDSRYVELILHMLNEVDLLEHGGTVGGSWPTDLGRQWLAILDNAESRPATSP
jgi:hypothetical protein